MNVVAKDSGIESDVGSSVVFHLPEISFIPDTNNNGNYVFSYEYLARTSFECNFKGKDSNYRLRRLYLEF